MERQWKRCLEGKGAESSPNRPALAVACRILSRKSTLEQRAAERARERVRWQGSCLPKGDGELRDGNGSTEEGGMAADKRVGFC
jgi:hypothetical protein